MHICCVPGAPFYFHLYALCKAKLVCNPLPDNRHSTSIKYKGIVLLRIIQPGLDEDGVSIKGKGDSAVQAISG